MGWHVPEIGNFLRVRSIDIAADLYGQLVMYALLCGGAPIPHTLSMRVLFTRESAAGMQSNGRDAVNAILSRLSCALISDPRKGLPV